MVTTKHYTIATVLKANPSGYTWALMSTIGAQRERQQNRPSDNTVQKIDTVLAKE